MSLEVALDDRACVIRELCLLLLAWTMSVLPCFVANASASLFARLACFEFCDRCMRLNVLTSLLVIGTWLAQCPVCSTLMMLLWTVYQGGDPKDGLRAASLPQKGGNETKPRLQKTTEAVEFAPWGDDGWCQLPGATAIWGRHQIRAPQTQGLRLRTWMGW